MAESNGLLGTRVMQLEYKIKAMAQRERKATIWRAALESWILKNFNYDLRLDVQLKLLQSENGSDDFESLEQNLNNSPNRVFMGQTSITKTRLPASAPSTPTSFTSRNNIGSSQYSSSPVRQVPQNISITTMAAPPSFSQQKSQDHRSPRNVQVHGTNFPRIGTQGGVRGVQRPVEMQANKRQRVASNVGYRAQSQPLVNYSRDMQTPIIVSTSSMAPKRKSTGPVKSPELILLDDEDESMPNVTVTRTLNPTPTPSNASGTPTTSSTCTTNSPSGTNSINSSNSSLFRTDANSLSSVVSQHNDSVVTSNSLASNNCSSTISSCPVSSVTSSINSSDINTFGTSSVNANCSYNSSNIPNNNSNFYASPYVSGPGPGIPNFGVITSSTPAYTSSSSEPTLYGNNGDNNTSNVQNLESFVENLTQENGGDSENSNGFDLSYQLINLLQLEAHYANNNFITRNEGVLMFNVRKILLDYEPSLHTELIQAAPRLETDLPLAYKKRINANVCHFLMQVYGENVPVVAKQAMADSLFDTFPIINKDEWFKKVPHKNATGCIHNRLSTLRKSLRDQRKRVEEDPSLVLV